MTVKTINMLNWHTRSHLKKCIPYSQALIIKRICSTFEEYRKHSQDLIKIFVEKGYNESTVRKQNERVDHIDRSLLLKHCKHQRKEPSAVKHKGNNKQELTYIEHQK